jgi:hypothetical protein
VGGLDFRRLDSVLGSDAGVEVVEEGLHLKGEVNGLDVEINASA